VETKSSIILPPELTDVDMAEMIVIANPHMWAEAHLMNPSRPTEPLILRDYQAKMLLDRHFRKIMRLGRRTGKSTYLAIEGLWYAFTHSFAQVLLTAAYETQVEGLFDLIRRMSFDSPHIKNSIVSYRKKPFELEFANRSVIRGLVANSSIRGKCLAEGTMVIMADNTCKPIEQIVPGDKVLTVHPEKHHMVVGEVVKSFTNGVQDVYELRTTAARRLILTDNHPLFVRGKGWTEVSKIRTTATHQPLYVDAIATVNNFGDAGYLPYANINWARVAVIKHIGKLPVYDIEIKDYHHFLAFYPAKVEESGFSVSKMHNGGILVHNSSDKLIVDEADYIPVKVLLEDIWPIATTFSHTETILSSTPSGRREFFYNVSVNKHRPEFNFHEFHVPSSRSPEWTKENEMFVRATTTRSQYGREYEAEFGEAMEGVFRHSDVDECLYVYDYKDLKYNPNNYYTLGVDWNETNNGVQIVILEHINVPIKSVIYNRGDWKLTNTTPIFNKFRIFRTVSIDALDYINVKAVDAVLQLMMEIKPHWSMFDHGHGHTNWELLRQSIKNGQSATGMKVIGLSHLLDHMNVLDFSSVIETIDPVTQDKLNHQAKNFIVMLAQNTFESHMLCVPAVNTEGTAVEDYDHGLVAQLRQYNVARRGKRGDVYEAGPAGDHKLDALMLALYAYYQEHDNFLHYDFNIKNTSASDNALRHRVSSTRINTMGAAPAGYKYSNGGILVHDYGDYAKPGEPPDEFEDELKDKSNISMTRRGHSNRTASMTRRGDRNL